MASDPAPYFSIVMPTRNRGHLLPYALQSALDQTFRDYEIVLIDNFSSDDTAKVAREVGGARVRYLRTEKVLPMHDNWEFALGQARGEWITFLCDDDALLPEALERIADCIKIHQPQLVGWPTGAYFIDSPSEAYPRTRRQIQVPRSSGRGTFTVPSRAELARLFSTMSPGSSPLPKMLNSCCHRRLIEKVTKQTGTFFLPPCPDYSCCVAMLANTDTYACVDANLGLRGCGAHHWGVAPTSGRPTVHVDFVEDFGAGDIVKCVPLSFVTYTNSIAESLLRARAALGAQVSGLDLDWVQYFVGCYEDMLPLKRHNVDLTAMRREFYRVGAPARAVSSTGSISACRPRYHHVLATRTIA